MIQARVKALSDSTTWVPIGNGAKLHLTVEDDNPALGPRIEARVQWGQTHFDEHRLEAMRWMFGVSRPGRMTREYVWGNSLIDGVIESTVEDVSLERLVVFLAAMDTEDDIASMALVAVSQLKGPADAIQEYAATFPWSNQIAKLVELTGVTVQHAEVR